LEDEDNASAAVVT